MSLVIINNPVNPVGSGPYYAVRNPNGTAWLVTMPHLTWGALYYTDDEVTRVPAHRGTYDPEHLGERYPAWYDNLRWAAEHRAAGNAN